MITVEAPNYRIRYSDDEIPRDKTEFLKWCRRTLWDKIESARVYKSYHTAKVVSPQYQNLRLQLKTRMDEITGTHDVVTCHLPQGECTSCNEYYELERKLVEAGA